MKNNKKLVWALVALLILIVLGGYLYRADPLGWQSGPETDEKQITETGSDTGDTEKAAETETSETETTTTAGKAEDSAEPVKEVVVELAVPTFDLVRVEPDGSTLIAGQAAPGTAVEVVSNGKVIAMVKAGVSGDFAAVLDDRLPPGDHEIVLRSTGDDEQSAQSEEIATVSVPESDPGELLVMVTKPGEASRILAKPEAAETEIAANQGSQETETASSTDSETDQAPATAEASSESATSQTAAATEPSADTETAAVADGSKSEGEATDTAAAGDTGTKVAMTDQTGSEESASTEPQQKAEDKPDVVKPETESVKAEPETTAAQSSETEMAKAEPAATAVDDSAAKTESVIAAEPTLRIDAVEIENGRMFVAGSATPGTQVRVYANNELLGASKVSATGRFLVEAQKDIAVGDHTISADLVLKSDEAVALRVAVPFTRPEGRMVAAVAAPEQEGSAQTEGEAQEAATQTESVAQEGATVSESQTSETSDSGAARTASEQPAGSATEQTSETASVQQQPAEKADEKASRVTVAETRSGQSTAAEEEPASDAATTATQTEVASADTGADDTRTVVQPALEQRDDSVIIRRGDTLWQISRRIYGRGVRYTTIYLANEDQIKNPDMIEPGQIFAVPDEPLDNAEELHRQRIRR